MMWNPVRLFTRHRRCISCQLSVISFRLLAGEISEPRRITANLVNPKILILTMD